MIIFSYKGKLLLCSLYRRINIMDKKIICKDCKAEFLFTEGEQQFYKEKGFDNEPVRCPECRKARKQQNNNNRR